MCTRLLKFAEFGGPSRRREPPEPQPCAVRPSSRSPPAAGRWPLAAGRQSLAANRRASAGGRWPVASGRRPGRWCQSLAASRRPLVGAAPACIARFGQCELAICARAEVCAPQHEDKSWINFLADFACAAQATGILVKSVYQSVDNQFCEQAQVGGGFSLRRAMPTCPLVFFTAPRSSHGMRVVSLCVGLNIITAKMDF